MHRKTGRGMVHHEIGLNWIYHGRLGSLVTAGIGIEKFPIAAIQQRFPLAQLAGTVVQTTQGAPPPTPAP